MIKITGAYTDDAGTEVIQLGMRLGAMGYKYLLGGHEDMAYASDTEIELDDKQFYWLHTATRDEDQYVGTIEGTNLQYTYTRYEDLDEERDIS